MIKAIFNSQGGGNHAFLVVSFLILMVSFCYADFTTYSNYVVYPLFVLWIPMITNNYRLLNKNERQFVVVSFIILLIILVYWLLGYSSSTTGNVLRDINWIVTGVISIYALNFFSKNEMPLVYVFSTVIIISLLFTYVSMGRVFLAIENQEDAAMIAVAWHGSLFMLITGLSLIVFLHVKSFKLRLFSLVFFLLTLYLNTFILQRGTNVLFTIVEIGLILLLTIKKKTVVYTVSILLLVGFIYLHSFVSLVDFFDWLAAVVPSERLSIRFNEISMVLAYQDMDVSTGSLAGRSELMWNSWHTFTSSVGYFLFGAGEHIQNNTIIGHHSFFLDTLARYGIIGGILVFVYFLKQYQISMRFLDKKKYWGLYMQCAVVFLLYVLRNGYGILAYALVNLFILFLFPLTIQVILYYKKQTKIAEI